MLQDKNWLSEVAREDKEEVFTSATANGSPSNDKSNKDVNFEFAGHSSSDDSNSDGFEFAGNSSDNQDCDTQFGEENNFFAGQSEDSFSSIDMYEHTDDISDSVNQYNFEDTEEETLEPYKHLSMNRKNKSGTPDLDLHEPSQLAKPEGQHCSRFCENNCSRVRNYVSFICEVNSIRAKFASMTRQARRNHLLDQLSHQEQFGLPVNIFYVKGEPLCVKFFSSVSGVSTRVLTSLIEDFNNGVQRYYHGLENTRKTSPEMMKFISWMTSFAKLHGEHKPDDNGVISLPSLWTKAKL